MPFFRIKFLYYFLYIPMNKNIILTWIFLAMAAIGGAFAYYDKENTGFLKDLWVYDLLQIEEDTTPVVQDTTPIDTFQNEHILVLWFPTSDEIKNTLIAIITPSTDTISYLPFNYYTGIVGSETLSRMEHVEMQKFFEEKGLNFLVDAIYLDQRDVFEMYAQHIQELPNPAIELVDSSGELREFPITSKENFYRLIRDNSNRAEVLEQIFHYILTQHIILTDSRFAVLDDITFRENFQENFLDTEFLLTSSEKDFSADTIQVGTRALTILRDEDYRFLQNFVTGDFSGTPIIAEEEVLEEEAPIIEEEVVEVQEEEPRRLSVRERLELQRIERENRIQELEMKGNLSIKERLELRDLLEQRN